MPGAYIPNSTASGNRRANAMPGRIDATCNAAFVFRPLADISLYGRAGHEPPAVQDCDGYDQCRQG